MIKRILSSLLIILLCSGIALSCLSCGAGEDAPEDDQTVTSGDEDEEPEVNMENTVIGKFIEVESVTPSGAKPTANNRGMSGLNSSVHLHGTASKDSYASDTPEPVIYDLGSVQRLGYMYVWNYNVKNALDCGLKEITVEYSCDGENFEKLGKQNKTLARALEEENELYGGNAANNLEKGREPVNFNGRSARYVRITPVSNYGGDKYGLSEVRFFAYKTRPAVGGEIYGFASAPAKKSAAENLVNGYGMSGESVSGDPSTMWSVGRSDMKDGYVVIDLDGSFPIDHITVYNYNDPSDLSSGLKNFKVEYTTENPCEISGTKLDYTQGKWQTLKAKQSISASTAEDCASVDVSFGGKNAQFIKITPLGNHGGDLAGLSAVRIYAAPGMASSPEYDWTGLFSCEGSFPYQQSVVNGTKGEGWLFADGIFSVNLNGSNMTGGANEETRTMFIFSDTFIGSFNDYPAGKYGVYGSQMNNRGMVNHSFGYLIGDKPDPRNMSFYLHNGRNASGNIVPYRDWLTGLTFVNGSAYTWGMRFNASWGADSMDFIKVKLDSDLGINIKKQPDTDQNVKMLTSKNGNDYMFGTAVFNNTVSAASSPDPDGYIYIYGYRSGWLSKKPIVARATEETFEDPEKWEFRSGDEWRTGIENTEIIGNVEVSAEYSVHYVTSGKYAGKYMMCYMEGTNSGKLCFAVSDTPYSGFDETIPVYYCNEHYSLVGTTTDTGIYTYNAKAQVHFSKSGEILMSYNVNSYNFDAKPQSREYLFPHFTVIYEITEGSTNQ